MLPEKLSEKPVVAQAEVTELAETQSEAAETTVVRTFTAQTSSMKIDVTAPAEAFPDDVVMKVTPVASQEVLASVEEASEKSVERVEAVDIAFYVGEEEIEPAVPITVRFSELAKEEAQDLAVMHVDAEGNASEVDAVSAEDEVVFESDQFSVYVLVYTVDFEYELNGQTYRFSLNGGEKINLSNLVEVLGILNGTSFESVEDFINEVADVKFSDESLVKVTQMEGDWELESLQAFNTEESLTITMKNGDVVTVKVSDDQSETEDITELLTDVTIYINGQPVTDDEWDVIKGNSYHLTLTFQEVNHGTQFPDDDTTMIYKLPAGFSLDYTTGKFDMSFGKLGELKDNTYEVLPDGTIKIHWNTSDEDFYWLTASSAAHFTIDLDVIFDGSQSSFEFNDNIQKTATIENPHDASVSKTGTYNANTGMMDYTITISSVGTTENIVVTDTITGSALTLDPSSLKYDGQPVNSSWIQSTSDSGFVLTIPSIGNGETKTLTYSAAVDYSKLGQNGTTTGSETGNGVVIAPTIDDNPDNNTSNTYTHNIQYSSVNKYAGAISDIDKDGYRTIEWKIKVNDEKKVSVAGDTITDSITSSSQSIMSYDQSQPITLIVTKADGTVVQRTVQWSDVISSDGHSWNYHVPADDGIASYEFTYYTKAKADTTGTQDSTVQNKVEDKYDSDTGTSVVKHDPKNDQQGQTEKISADKIYTEVTEDYIEWNIVVSVPKDGLDELIVTDTFPNVWIDNVIYYDSLVEGSISVTGINPPETFSTETTTGQYWKDGVQITKETGVKLTFFKDAAKTQQGLNEANSERTITITLRTKNNPDVIKYVKENPKSTSLNDHKNVVKVNNVQKEKIATVMQKGVKKKGEKKADADKTVDGVVLPAFLYQVQLTGLNRDSFDIEDTFDTSIFEVVQETSPWYSLTISGGSQYDQQLSPTPITAEQTSTGVIFHVTSVPKDASMNNVYYPAYCIRYYLRVKDVDALKKLQQQAAESGGTTKIHNVVNWDGATSSTDIDYTYKVVSKNVSYPSKEDTDRYPHYTITINPNCDVLNNGNTMTLTDTFTNQSVDFKSITIKVYNSDGSEDTESESKITYDFRGNVGTFYVPDGKKVVIEYDATVIGDGVVEFTNTALLNGKYGDTIEETKEQNVKINGGAPIVYIDLFKYEREYLKDETGNYVLDEKGNKIVIGHMEDGLNGAVFRLLDSNKEPVLDKNGNEITFTTSDNSRDAQGKNGYAMLMLHQEQQGLTLDWETTYYIEEITPPTGYAKDNIQYSFQISDHANYEASDGAYVYHVGDILKVADWKAEPGLTISKRFAGNESLTNEQKDSISFRVTGPFNSKVAQIEGITVENANYSGNSTIIVPYSLFSGDGVYTFKFDAETIRPGTFTVNEVNANVDGCGYTWSGKYSVNSGSDITMSTPDQTTDVEVINGQASDILYTNSYNTNSFKLLKLKNGTEQDLVPTKLQYAVFTVYKFVEGEFVATDLTYTTARNGTFELKKTDSSIFEDDTAYYLMETAAPEGYLLPESPEKYYFYFGSSENGNVPVGISSDVEAYDLNHENGSVTALNELRPTKSVSVKKVWDGAEAESIMVQLMRVKADTETEDVAVGDPIALRADNHWSYTWDDLPDGVYYVVETTNLEGYESATYQVEGGTEEPVTTASEVTIDLSQTSSLTTGTIVVTNKQETDEIIVKKEWIGLSGQRISAPADSIQFQLIQTIMATGSVEGKTEDSVTVFVRNDNNAGSDNTGISVNAIPGDTVTFACDNLVLDYGSHTHTATVEIYYWDTVSNQYHHHWEKINSYASGTNIDITVVNTDMCILIKGNAVSSESFEKLGVSLTNNSKQNVSEEEIGEIIYNAETQSEDVNKTYTLSSSNGWSMRFSDLPKTGTSSDGKTLTYRYKIKEVTPGYSVTYSPAGTDDTSGTVSSGTLTITNTVETTSISVNKVWAGSWPEGRDPSVYNMNYQVNVQLFKDDQPYGEPAVLTESTDWSYTWSDLPKSSSNYRIEEISVVDASGADITDKFDISYSTEEPISGETGGSITITNSRTVDSYALPSTGGFGTTCYIGSGLLLLLAAALLYIKQLQKRRMRRR